MSDVVFLSGKHTPFGTFLGSLSKVSAIDLGVMFPVVRGRGAQRAARQLERQCHPREHDAAVAEGESCFHHSATEFFAGHLTYTGKAPIFITCKEKHIRPLILDAQHAELNDTPSEASMLMRRLRVSTLPRGSSRHRRSMNVRAALASLCRNMLYAALGVGLHEGARQMSDAVATDATNF